MQIRLDWELFDDPPSDDNPKAISQPPGHPDVAALTDMNGNYSFDFSFVAEHSARHYGTRIRVVAEVENAAAFDGILGRGAIFGDHAYVDIPSEGNDITAQDRDLNVDEIPGAALRFLYRARQFTIDELDYTPVGDQGQVRFFFLPNRFPDTGGVFYCNGSSPFDSGSPCIGTCDTDAPVNLNDLSNNCQPIPPQSADRIVWGRDPDAGSGYHEYGHFVEFDKVGKQVYDDIGGPHTFVTISTDNVAWTEGWAEFFDAACHMYWYSRELPETPEPRWKRYTAAYDDGYSYQWLDHSQRFIPDTGDLTQSEGAVACFLHSLWDGLGPRAPNDNIHPDYVGDNDDLTLTAATLLERIPERWTGTGLTTLRADTNIESYRDALLGVLDDQHDASLNALYNSLVLRTGQARSATATALSISGDHDSRSLCWSDNSATSAVMEWTEGTENRARIDVDENNEEGFRIFRKSGDLELWDGTLTGYTELDSVGQDVTSWTDDVDLETGTYRYIVTAYNGGGNSIPRTEAPVIVIAPPPNESPTQPEGLAEVSVAENTRTTGASYTSTDPEGTTPLEWSLTGDDAGRLDIEGGLLTFPTAPDFENPKDRDKDRVYQVEVVASDGELSSPSLAVAVTVLNVNEPGMVSLTSTTLNLTAMAPEIGMQLTAMLSDPDEGVRGEAWHWQSSADGDAWTPILGANGDPVTGPTYTVEVTDRGRRLRATVTYLDGLSIDGTDRRTASSGGTAPVSGLAGSITGTESWSGDVYVGGDVTIERGASLTISGAVVHFLAPEGSDGNGRSELIVASGGSLAAGAGVSFRSGGTAEAHGLRVETGGTATLSGLTIADGEHRLRAGPGDLIVRGDLKVAGGATLHIHQDSEVRFEDRTDETAGGESRNLSEVIVLGTLRASEVRFRTVHDDPESPGWYGIRARRVASRRGAVVLRESRLSHGQRCVHDQGGSLVLVNTRFEDCGLIRGPRSVSFMENGEGVVETYRSRPELRRPDGYETLRWKLKKVLGEDTGDFTLSGSGQLRFRPPPPDFEAPRGSDPDNPNNYRVTIEAREANLCHRHAAGRGVGERRQRTRNGHPEPGSGDGPGPAVGGHGADGVAERSGRAGVGARLAMAETGAGGHGLASHPRGRRPGGHVPGREGGHRPSAAGDGELYGRPRAEPAGRESSDRARGGRRYRHEYGRGGGKSPSRMPTPLDPAMM